MLRFCVGCQHLVEDGIDHPPAKISSTDEFVQAVNAIGHEQAVCKDCWEGTMKTNEIAWIDGKYKHYRMHEITDGHLLKIIEFISNGGGYDHFLTKDKVVNLLKEAFDRGLIRTE